MSSGQQSKPRKVELCLILNSQRSRWNTSVIIRNVSARFALEDLFARITNYNPHANSMEKILAAVPQGFCVNAVFEFDRLGTEFLPRFVRIELTPKRE